MRLSKPFPPVCTKVVDPTNQHPAASTPSAPTAPCRTHCKWHGPAQTAQTAQYAQAWYDSIVYTVCAYALTSTSKDCHPPKNPLFYFPQLVLCLNLVFTLF